MKREISQINQYIDYPIDVIIASASYEERCKSLINHLKIDSCKYKLVSISAPHKDFFKESIVFFEDNNFKPIYIDNQQQIVTALRWIDEINAIITDLPDASFLIDITTFTKQTLLILLRILRNSLSRSNKIKFIYTPAKEYSIGLKAPDKWLSKGILEVNSVFGYSGIIRPSRPFHLILTMGFEVERASSLINAYEPSRISVGYAKRDCSISDNLYEINIEKFNNLLSEFPNAESFEFSCVDVDDCKNDLLIQTKKYKDHNIIISPMNNKIATLASALAAFDDDEIQLAISIPALYNYENYSIPSDYIYLFEINGFIKNS